MRVSPDRVCWSDRGPPPRPRAPPPAPHPHVVGAQHPIQVVAGGPGHLGERDALVLAAVEHELAALLGEPAVELGHEGPPLVAVGVESGHVAREVSVTVQLGRQDRRSGANVPQRGVRVLVVPGQVEAGRRREVAGLFAVKDHLHVDQATPLHVEGHARAAKLGQQDGQVVVANVEARQVARLQQLGQRLRGAAKRVFVRHDVVGDTVNGGRLRGNGNFRIVASHLLQDVTLRRYAQDGEFHDPVARQAQTRGLEVEEDDGAVEVEGQFHGWDSVAGGAGAPHPGAHSGRILDRCAPW